MRVAGLAVFLRLILSLWILIVQSNQKIAANGRRDCKEQIIWYGCECGLGGDDPNDPGVDQCLLEGVDPLRCAQDADGNVIYDGPTARLPTGLTQQELDTVGVDGDPTRGQGMFIANVVHCSMTQMKEITLEPNQLSLYPEAYAAYSRTVDDAAPPYLPGWTATFTSTENALLSNQFTATSRSSLRLVPDSEDARFGAVMVRAGFFPEPAVFESEGSEFSVDFQVETWHPRGDDEVVHFYGMWRYMKLGILGDSYEQTFIDQTLQGMIDWDTKTDTLCAGG